MHDKPIDITDFKDALLASLYCQVEISVTGKELPETDLIIQDGEKQLNGNSRKNRTSTGTSSEGRDSHCNESVHDLLVGIAIATSQHMTY